MKIASSQIRTNAGGFIPEGLYRARCIATKHTAKNSSGQRMTTLDCEVIEPESIEINGKSVIVAGRKFSMFLIHNIERTGWASQEQVMRFAKKLNVDLEVDENGDEVYDDDLHKEYYHGMEFDIVLKAEEDIKRYERQPGEKVGRPILDGEGKEISNGWRITANPDDVPDNCKPTKNEEIAAQPY